VGYEHVAFYVKAVGSDAIHCTMCEKWVRIKCACLSASPTNARSYCRDSKHFFLDTEVSEQCVQAVH